MPGLPDQYVWLAWSSAFVAAWGAFFIACPALRRPLWWVGLCTAPFGSTEFFFVGRYWNPPSVLNLARADHLDVESYLFCFGIGGVAAVLFNAVFRQPLRVPLKTSAQGRHQQWYVFALLFPFLAYLPWLVITDRPLWAGVAVMTVGAVAAIYPTLRVKTFAGGVLFLAYYLLFLAILTRAFPGYMGRVWIRTIPGGWLGGIPWAELCFGLTFGAFWSGIYEQVLWIFSAPHRIAVIARTPRRL